MDFAGGKAALLQAVALMDDEDDVTVKISTVMDSIQAKKTCTVSLICEVLALQHKDIERRKKCAELLGEATKWWERLVADRGNLLRTISNLEMEKEAILKKQTNPEKIYGRILEATQTAKRSQSLSHNTTTVTTNVENDDDFIT